jgi:hypothetical protein
VANGDLYLFISFLPALNVEIGSEWKGFFLLNSKLESLQRFG